MHVLGSTCSQGDLLMADEYVCVLCTQFLEDLIVHENVLLG